MLDTRCFENVIHGLPITAGQGDYSSPHIPYSAQCICRVPQLGVPKSRWKNTRPPHLRGKINKRETG
jgi:hypothetical protein